MEFIMTQSQPHKGNLYDFLSKCAEFFMPIIWNEKYKGDYKKFYKVQEIEK